MNSRWAEHAAADRHMKLGDIEFHILNDGTFRLDGGAMFGVIPKPMWERVAPADEQNRITLAMNSLLIRAAGKWILVETGAGDKWDAKRREIYAFEGARAARAACRARRAARADRYRGEYAPALRSLRLEHAHRRWRGRAHVSQREVLRASGRIRARAASHRARSRQLLPREFRAHGQNRAVASGRGRRRRSRAGRGADRRFPGTPAT